MGDKLQKQLNPEVPLPREELQVFAKPLCKRWLLLPSLSFWIRPARAAGVFCAQVWSEHIEGVQPLMNFWSQTLPQLWNIKALTLSQGTQFTTFGYLHVCLHTQLYIHNFWAKQQWTSFTTLESCFLCQNKHSGSHSKNLELMGLFHSLIFQSECKLILQILSLERKTWKQGYVSVNFNI